FEKYNDFDNAWRLLKENEYISFETIKNYESKLSRELLDFDLIIKICGYSYLTEFGQNNIDKIIKIGFEKIKNLELEKNKKIYKIFKNPNTIVDNIRIIIKKAEDEYRESIGMPKIGEGWISETELFYKISS